MAAVTQESVLGKLAQLEQKITQVNQSRNAIVTTVRDRLQMIINTVQDGTARMQGQRDAHDAAQQASQRQIDQSTANIDQLRQQLAQLTAEHGDVNQRLQLSNQLNQRLQTALNECNANSERIQGLYDNLQRQHMDHTQQVTQALQQLDQRLNQANTAVDAVIANDTRNIGDVTTLFNQANSAAQDENWEATNYRRDARTLSTIVNGRVNNDTTIPDVSGPAYDDARRRRLAARGPAARGPAVPPAVPPSGGPSGPAARGPAVPPALGGSPLSDDDYDPEGDDYDPEGNRRKILALTKKSNRGIEQAIKRIPKGGWKTRKNRRSKRKSKRYNM